MLNFFYLLKNLSTLAKMFMDVVRRCMPTDWSSTHSYNLRDYELIDLPAYSSRYLNIHSNVAGTFNLGTKKIVRVENPYLYGQFLLKKEEYVTRGYGEVRELYHDTGEHKIASIVSSNLDWRVANRVKFGKGVSFSPSPSYANQESSRNNGTDRAMIIADVLVGSKQHVVSSTELPATGYDTTIGNCDNVYVKYYDNEFYPKYVAYYTSRPHVRRYHRGLW